MKHDSDIRSSSANGSKPERVSTTELAISWLPESIREAVKGVELTVEEVFEWENSKSPARIIGTDEHIIVEARIYIPKKRLKQALLACTSLSGVSGIYLTVEKLLG